MLKPLMQRLRRGDGRPINASLEHEQHVPRRAPSRPVFVGGTGRSGTHVAAWLLGAHPANYRFPAELRFIAASGGLCDLVEGRTDLRHFEKRMLGRWFERLPRSDPDRSAQRATVEALLKKHRAGFRSEPWMAAAAFTHDLLDPLSVAAGATSWIEKTPANALAAPTLLRLFPEMRLVHCLRDGRDVACSVTIMRWGPTDVDEALDWWAGKVDAGLVACRALPTDRLHVVQMENLIEHDREREYARLLAFMGLEDHPAMRAYFDSDLTPERAHIGRWRSEVPAERLESFQAHYLQLAERLRARHGPYFAGAVDPEPDH